MRCSANRWVTVCSILGIGIVCILVSTGAVRAYSRGGNDFSVFYEAWKLVLSGRGAEIYRVSPDRFLYSPGFAWLLAPLGLFPRNISLGIWCGIKLLAVLSVIWNITGTKLKEFSLITLGLGAWGVVLMARPLLIDLEYGQVNLLILSACVWGLLTHVETRSKPWKEVLSWLLLTFAALAKLYPLPLLLVPWFVKSGMPAQKIRRERLAIIAGTLVTFLIPWMSQGWGGLLSLMSEWQGAVLARGLPLESHNQSFTALLYHYLSDVPTPVISEGARPLMLGQGWLSPEQIVLLSLFWTISTMGVTLGWIFSGTHHSNKQWVSVAIGLLIVPSHLIWKPYFVMGIPLALLILRQAITKMDKFSFVLIAVLFIGINLTGFDFVGHNWAAHIEAASFLLLFHLMMLAMGMWDHKTQPK